MNEIEIYNLIVLFLILALQAADAWLTVEILIQGGREKNPLLIQAMDRFGVRQALYTVKVAIMALLAAAWFFVGDKPELAYSFTLVFFIYVWVVVHNYRELKK